MRRALAGGNHRPQPVKQLGTGRLLWPAAPGQEHPSMPRGHPRELCQRLRGIGRLQQRVQRDDRVAGNGASRSSTRSYSATSRLSARRAQPSGSALHSSPCVFMFPLSAKMPHRSALRARQYPGQPVTPRSRSSKVSRRFRVHEDRPPRSRPWREVELLLPVAGREKQKHVERGRSGDKPALWVANRG